MIVLDLPVFDGEKGELEEETILFSIIVLYNRGFANYGYLKCPILKDIYGF